MTSSESGGVTVIDCVVHSFSVLATGAILVVSGSPAVTAAISQEVCNIWKGKILVYRRQPVLELSLVSERLLFSHDDRFWA